MRLRLVGILFCGDQPFPPANSDGEWHVPGVPHCCKRAVVEPGTVADAIRLSVRQAPPLISEPLFRLVKRLDDRWPTWQALFAMADDHHRRLVPGNNGVFKRSVVSGGRVVGTWTRAGRPGRRTLEIDGFVPISEAARSRLEARYGEFPFAAD